MMCFRYLGLVALFFSSFACVAADIPSMKSGNYSEYCSDEWTKRGELDRRMFEYCLKLQQEGYAELKILAAKYKDQSWMQAAINFSVNEWTKKGTRQDRMVAFKLKLITEGWEDLVYEAKQKNYNRSKYEFCYKKWNPQFNMVAFCYKNGS